MKTTSILIGLAGIMATALVAAEVQNYATAATSDQSQQAVVDEQGNLRVPEDYRTAYQFLGAWAIAAEQGKGSQQLHVVYASPGTIAAYRKDGSFPDGSNIGEVVEATTAPMKTGNTRRATSVAAATEKFRSIDPMSSVQATLLKGRLKRDLATPKSFFLKITGLSRWGAKEELNRNAPGRFVTKLSAFFRAGRIGQFKYPVAQILSSCQRRHVWPAPRRYCFTLANPP